MAFQKKRPSIKNEVETKILHPMKAFGSVTSKTEGIRINRLEDRKVPLVPFPHKHDFYHLLLITKGRGWHEIDFERFPIARGKFFVMRPGQVHTWSLAPLTKGLIVEFEAEVLASKDIRWNQLSGILGLLPNGQSLDRKSQTSLEELIEDALAEEERKEKGYELLLLAYLARLIIMLGRLTAGELRSTRASSEIHQSFTDLVEAHYKVEHSVEFYAKTLKIAPKALTMRFYRDGYPSPRVAIQERCLLEAKRLLAYSNLSIGEIADSLGFDDPNYFSRFFRKLMAESPGSFRSKS